MYETRRVASYGYFACYCGVAQSFGQSPAETAEFSDAGASYDEYSSLQCLGVLYHFGAALLSRLPRYLTVSRAL